MPIEIRELTIKVNVNQDQNKTAAQGAGGSNEENEKKEALIQEAVEEALRILENKKER
jgi:hypothetical protein